MKTITLTPPPPHKYDLNRCIRGIFAHLFIAPLTVLALTLALLFPTLAAAQTPAKATGLSVVVENGGNRLNWDRTPGVVTDYEITFRTETGTFGLLVNLATSSHPGIEYFQSLSADPSSRPVYIYRIRAINDLLEGAYSDVASTAPNNAPTANAGDAQTVMVGATVTLTGDATDSDGGDSHTYTWTQSGTPAVSLMAVSGALHQRAFIAPDMTSAITLTFNLVVNDGEDDSAMATVNVVVNPTPTTPDNPPTPDTKAQVTAVVSEVARAIVSSTVSAVANRISAIASGGGVNVGGAQVGGVNVAGVNLNDSNMASILQTNTQAFTTNSDAMKTLLGNSTFSMPLNAKGGGGGGFDSVAVWASGEYSDVSGESNRIDWDGDLSGFHVGIDGKINTGSADNILIGVAISALNGDLDYTDETDGTDTATTEKGNYEIDMTTISPYIGWRVGGIDLWASVGVGEGEIELSRDADAMPDADRTYTSDAEQTAFAIGGSGVFHAQDSYNLRMKGELSIAELDIDDSDEEFATGANPKIAEQNLKATHVKVSIEATQTNDLERGGSFDKSVEIGARLDGGDGETGTSVEIGGKLKYAHSVIGFTAEGSARFLLGRDGDYEEWGIQGTLRKQVGRDGQGLSFHLTPAYGDINSGIQQLLAQGLSDSANDDANTTDPDYHINLTTRLGYGIAYRGMVTPYTEMVLGITDQYRMGINWKPSKVFSLTLLGEQANQNAIRLQGEVNF